MLTASKRNTHLLRDELALCEAYLAVEQARFGERLHFNIEVDQALDRERVEVPVLVLQPLVENAIKHGVSNRAKAGWVQIVARRTGDQLLLEVADDGVGFGNSPRRGTGTGIAVCRERLALAFGTNAALETQTRPGGGSLVVVRLPLVVSSGVA